MSTKQAKRDDRAEQTVKLQIAGHSVTLIFAAEPDATVAQRVRNCLIDSYISQNMAGHRGRAERHRLYHLPGADHQRDAAQGMAVY